MSAIHIRAPLAAGAFACLFAMASAAQSPAAAGPWAQVPAPSTACYQNTAAGTADPWYAKLEAAKAAIAVDRDRQEAINAQVEEDFRNIDPMEKAQRMQQWMMSNPQEAAAYMQGVQNAAAQAPSDLQSAVTGHQAKEAEWNALRKSYADARARAYAPLLARRNAYHAKTGSPAMAAADNVDVPVYHPETAEDTAEAESITVEYERAYQALCPQWWGANGKIHAYLKKEKDRFATERTAELATKDARKLQQYAMMSTPAATYRSTAPQQAALEYLDLVDKVLREREAMTRCGQPGSCDGAYP